MDDEPLILGFEAPLAELARSLQRFEKNYQKLGVLNDHCVRFNETFGQIFTALQLTSSCYDYGELPRSSERPPPVKPSGSSDTVQQPSKPNAGTGNISTKTEEAEPIAAPATKTENKREAVKPRGKENASTRAAKKAQIDTRKVLSRCPPKYQNPPHRANIEMVLRILKSNPTGLYQNDIVDNCNINRNHCIEYINMLLRIGECVRESRKGFVYKLHPKHDDVAPAKTAPATSR